ncbi:hypothetical protein CEXT_258091 [Caerostris extrusa]|uniref:Uncharacterized protein n=1 Tax=Caerostris extrusa TaxID=172846 RepID=A0AAV4P2W2_CAEEX|nr:hypothetical protein CEXT_258091 [Caerostris extrusa]
MNSVTCCDNDFKRKQIVTKWAVTKCPEVLKMCSEINHSKTPTFYYSFQLFTILSTRKISWDYFQDITTAESVPATSGQHMTRDSLNSRFHCSQTREDSTATETAGVHRHLRNVVVHKF